MTGYDSSCASVLFSLIVLLEFGCGYARRYSFKINCVEQGKCLHLVSHPIVLAMRAAGKRREVGIGPGRVKILNGLTITRIDTAQQLRVVNHSKRPAFLAVSKRNRRTKRGDEPSFLIA